MNYFLLNAEGIQLKRTYRLILIFLVFSCEMVVPIKGWTQSFQDTGSFTFTGTHNPLSNPIPRELLTGEGLTVGPVQIHPFLGVAEIFTDNVFRTKNQRESDFLTTIAPGIQAYLPFGEKHSFLLDYRAAQFIYAKTSENNVLSQEGQGRLRLNFPGGLKIDLYGGPVEGFDRRGSVEDIQNREITKWRAINFTGEASLRSSRGGVRLQTQYTGIHYKNNQQDAIRDRKSISTRLTGLLNVTKAISGLLGLRVGNTIYDENKQLNSFSYGAFTGFEIAPSRLFSGGVTVGYTVVNFDRAPIVALDPAPSPPAPLDKGNQLLNDGLSLGGNTQKRITIEGDLLWKPTSQLTVNVSPYRRIQQSGFLGTSTFVQTGVGLTVRKALKRRLAIVGGFNYSNDKFQEGREDNRFMGRAGLDYRTAKWLGFRLGYIFEQRNSNQSPFDTYSNTISLSVQGLL